MERFVIFKREDHYSGMPNIEVLPDGRLVAAARVQTHAYHEPVGDWVAFESKDDGETWSETDDPTMPYNWPGTTPREKMERLETVLPDGTYFCAGAVDIADYFRRHSPVTPTTVFVSATDHLEYDRHWLVGWNNHGVGVTQERLPWETAVPT